MESKTFIEASCNSNIHTGEKVFCSCYFYSFLSLSVQTEQQNL